MCKCANVQMNFLPDELNHKGTKKKKKHEEDLFARKLNHKGHEEITKSTKKNLCGLAFFAALREIHN